MPYYVFNNFTKYLNNIIEKENGNGNNDESGLDTIQKTTKQTMGNAMATSKNMFKNSGAKIPKK